MKNPIGFGRKSEENVSGLKYFEQLFCRLVYYKRIQKGEISNYGAQYELYIINRQIKYS